MFCNKSCFAIAYTYNACTLSRTKIQNFVFFCCRFKGEIERDGFIDAEGHAYCISPLLYETGWIPFAVSTDGKTFDRSGEYLSGVLLKYENEVFPPLNLQIRSLLLFFFFCVHCTDLGSVIRNDFKCYLKNTLLNSVFRF